MEKGIGRALSPPCSALAVGFLHVHGRRDGLEPAQSLGWLVLVLCHVGNYLTRISRRRDLSNNPIVHAASPRSVGPGYTLTFD
ncbi:hypothetical protein BDW66DRAFT_92203 [Aspergillus desertorum]